MRPTLRGRCGLLSRRVRSLGTRAAAEALRRECRPTTVVHGGAPPVDRFPPHEAPSMPRATRTGTAGVHFDVLSARVRGFRGGRGAPNVVEVRTGVTLRCSVRTTVKGQLDRRRFLRTAVLTAGAVGAAVVLEPLRFAAAAPGADRCRTLTGY